MNDNQKSTLDDLQENDPTYEGTEPEHVLTSDMIQAGVVAFELGSWGATPVQGVVVAIWMAMEAARQVGGK
jgi:hypothetical protein